MLSLIFVETMEMEIRPVHTKVNRKEEREPNTRGKTEEQESRQVG